MSYVKTTVREILSDTAPTDAWKLQELQRLLFREERSRDDKKQAIETLEASKPKDRKKNREWLDANRHDYELHKENIESILEAIADIRERTIGKQLDLFE